MTFETSVLNDFILVINRLKMNRKDFEKRF
jgi:hypothetical protein